MTALSRLQPRGGTASVAGVRERHHLRTARKRSLSLRVALAHLGDAEALMGSAGTALKRAGGEVGVFSGATWSDIAARVNEYDAEVCIAVEIVAEPSAEAAYFETEGFASVGGTALARLSIEELPANPNWPLGTVVGKRLAILRETRPPTVAIRIGPSDVVAEQRGMIAAALTRALARWSINPC